MISKPKAKLAMPADQKADMRYIIVKNDGSNMADIQALLDAEYYVTESWVVGNSIHHLLVKIGT